MARIAFQAEETVCAKVLGAERNVENSGHSKASVAGLQRENQWWEMRLGRQAEVRPGRPKLRI